MKKSVLFLMIICIICITGCGLTKGKENESTEKVEINQKIVLIYKYVNYADTPIYIGFYVNSEGRKVQFDFSENAESFIKEKKVILAIMIYISFLWMQMKLKVKNF